MCDYAWHVQSGSGDVINLFQQETDAWMSHINTHAMSHTHTRTHTRLLSGKQSQRHGVTETKPQKRRLALCDNPLTHIYIQGLEYASVPPSPTPAARCFAPPSPTSSLPSSLPSPIYLRAFHLIRPKSSCYLSLRSIFHSPCPETLSLLGFICLLSVDGTWPFMAAPID